MNKAFLLFISLILLSFCIYGQPTQVAPRNYLQKKGETNPDLLFENLEQWRANKKISIVKKIQDLPETDKQVLIAQGNEVLKTDWTSLHASKFLDFKLNGNRSRFEAESNLRRYRLSQLLAAELAEGKGRYLFHLIDGLWLVLEQSSWMVPAHIIIGKNSKDGLPNPDEEILDLVAGETAALVAWTRLLLKDKLDSISPAIVKRIDYELHKKIYDPYLNSEFKWMGLTGQKTNNWNIWINKNVLLTIFLAVDDPSLRNTLLRRNLLLTDNFLNGYPEDGSCDEGSTYWGHAGGKLIEHLQLLQEASANQFDFSDSKLIHRIGRFILDTHIQGNYFVNHGDGGAIFTPPIHAVYRYGELFKDQEMLGFASYLRSLSTGGKDWLKATNFNDFTNSLFTYKEIASIKPQLAGLKRIWMPDLQQLILSSNKDPKQGLFFAANGGHNGQSHNHNDVGNFIIYHKGAPVIIDAGVGTYTKQTFSSGRYQLWYMQSRWHNCPDINGVQQKNGAKYTATNVAVDLKNKNISRFSMDIASAYPDGAAVQKWVREWIFNRNKEEVTLKESFSLKEFKQASDIQFLTVNEIDSSQPGKILLKAKDGSAVAMKFDPALFELLIEEKEVGDGKLARVWGKTVNKIILRKKSKALEGVHDIVFSIVK